MKDSLTDTILASSDSLPHSTQIIRVVTGDADDHQLLTNGITIVLALIAGLIALYQVKANIISGARMTWVNQLRDTISAYCMKTESCAILIQNMVDECEGKSGTEITAIIKRHYEGYSAACSESGILANKILLYLDPGNKKHKQIEALVNGISEHLHKKKATELNRDKIEADLSALIRISKKIFMEETRKASRLFSI